MKINLTTNSVVSSYFYSDVTKHISNFAIENGAAYYTVGAGVYKFDLSSNALPGTPAFTTTAQGVSSVYSLAVFQNHIYVGDAGDFTNNGHVYIYATGTGFEPPAIGTLQKSLAVGVAPAGFYFNF